jgi:hypothetical protein
MHSQVRYFLTICYVNYLFFLYWSLLLEKVAFRHSLIKHYKHGIYMTSDLSFSLFVATPFSICDHSFLCRSVLLGDLTLFDLQLHDLVCCPVAKDLMGSSS